MNEFKRFAGWEGRLAPASTVTASQRNKEASFLRAVPSIDEK
jgi:hypothetical protein